MDERVMYINPTLFIKESREWLYLIVDEKVYQIKMDEKQRKELHEVIAYIQRGEEIQEKEEKQKILLLLKKIGIVQNYIQEEQRSTLFIRSLKYLDEPKLLSDLSKGQIHIDEEKGFYAYLSENELILAKKEIVGGNFLKPCKKQLELIVQILLKNEVEIIEAMIECTYLSIPLLSYIKGVRILKEYVGKEDAHDYVWIQPWYTELEIEDHTYYPLVRVYCKIDNMSFEAVGNDTEEALYYIYDEYRGIREEKERRIAVNG